MNTQMPEEEAQRIVTSWQSAWMQRRGDLEFDIASAIRAAVRGAEGEVEKLKESLTSEHDYTAMLISGRDAANTRAGEAEKELAEWMAGRLRAAMDAGLERYGIRWAGPQEPICELMPDGYWTPWHIAGERLSAATARAEKAEARVRELEGAIDRIGYLSNALRHGGPDPSDLHGLSDALEEAVDIALSMKEAPDA